MRRWAALPELLLGPMFTLDAVRVGRRHSTFVVRGLYLVGLAVILELTFLAGRAKLGGQPVRALLAV